uniref:CRAL-TRIO domain-containing protein n=1 Tax=Glossina brevipalpis TaxID=37001 RepID=A0A1A9WEN3_9MUSC
MYLDLRQKYTSDRHRKIKLLNKLIEKSRDLSVGCDDVFLTKFLSFAKWDVNKAYESLRRYYDFKAEHPDWLAHHPVEYFRDHFLETRTRFVMPHPDKDGRPIVIIKSVDAFSKFPNYLQDIIEMDDLVFESLLLLPRVQRFGITLIFDLNGMTHNFLRMLSPTFARLVNEKNTILPFPCRVIHIIHSGFLMNAAISMVMPFLSNEFKETIFSHDGKNFNKLREMVGYESLPAEYGGPETNQLDVNLLYNHIIKHSEYLQNLQNYKKVNVCVKYNSNNNKNK